MKEYYTQQNIEIEALLKRKPMDQHFSKREKATKSLKSKTSNAYFDLLKFQKESSVERKQQELSKEETLSPLKLTIDENIIERYIIKGDLELQQKYYNSNIKRPQLSEVNDIVAQYPKFQLIKSSPYERQLKQNKNYILRSMNSPFGSSNTSKTEGNKSNRGNTVKSTSNLLLVGGIRTPSYERKLFGGSSKLSSKHSTSPFRNNRNNGNISRNRDPNSGTKSSMAISNKYSRKCISPITIDQELKVKTNIDIHDAKNKRRETERILNSDLMDVEKDGINAYGKTKMITHTNQFQGKKEQIYQTLEHQEKVGNYFRISGRNIPSLKAKTDVNLPQIFAPKT